MIRFLYIAVSLCLMSSAQALIRPQPGDFGLQFEFLWLYPTLEGNFFVINGELGSSQSNITGNRVDNKTQGYPVIRLEGVYAFCNCENEFRLRGTYFDRNRTTFKRVTGTNLYPTIGTPGGGDNEPENYTGEASQKIKLDYFNVEGLFGQILYRGCPFFLSLNAGIEFARLDFQDNTSYIPTDGDDTLFLKNRAHYWGWGPEFLVDAGYELPSWLGSCFGGIFSLRGEFRGSLLYGKSNATFLSFSTTVTETRDIKNYGVLKLVPAWGGRLSLNYDGCFCSCVYNIELGYQALFYEGTTDKIRFLNAPVEGASEDFYSQFGLVGPFIGIGVKY